MFRTDNTPNPEFTEVLEINLTEIVPTLAGPKRPQDKVSSFFNEGRICAIHFETCR